MQREAWSADEVATRLRLQMHEALARVVDASERWGADWRTAAMAVGVERVAEASAAAGGVPVSGPPVDWDAAAYDRLADPQEEWGREVLNGSSCDGDETVLDAGCGTGPRDQPAARPLPAGRVIGVDGSPAMIEQARASDRVGDARRAASIGDLLDARARRSRWTSIFSNATFHWILDHERLFARLFAALRPGGRLEAQCGGEGNVAEMERALEALAGDERFAPYFARSAADLELRVRGRHRGAARPRRVRGERVWLEPRPVTPPDPRRYVATAVLPWHLDRLPADAPRRRSSTPCSGSMPRPLVLDYVRLNISAGGGRRDPDRASSPGDGIGPEIIAAARRVLDAVGEFAYEEHPVGGASIDAHGTALTDEVLEACRAADAVLLGAVGGPKWDTTDPDAPRPEQGLLGLRKGLGLFANLRPVRPSPALAGASPLRPSVIAGTDLLVVRELTGGIYFGEKTRTDDSASDACVYTAAEVERIARVAFEAAGAAPRPRHLGRQGERARDLAPVARGGRPASRRTTRTSSSTTCSSTTRRCSSSRTRRAST